MAEEESKGGWLLLGILLFLALIFTLCLRYRAPAPLPASAPATQFSAARASSFLRALLGAGAPHPVGSLADDAVRSRIVSLLASLGYSPQIQKAFSCNDWGICANVQNILAVLPGSASGPAVLLSAHYDSVPAGPGASDDGMGVAAILEIARALKALPPLPHTVIILINEGEEAGLLGAQAFVQESPLAGQIRAAVNIDNRGTFGPSLMFETGSANNWLVSLYSASVPHPITSSAYYSAYKQLPNDTDFTVYKAAGYTGFNFAIIGGVQRYHTPLDNVENASLASLQHHGNNALAALRALASAPLAPPPPGEAVYFDLLGFRLVHWPRAATMPLALLGAALLVFAMLRLHSAAPPLRLAAILTGAFFLPLVSLLAGACTWGLMAAFSATGALPAQWVAHPHPLLLASWGLGFALPLLFAQAIRHRSNFWSLWLGLWLFQALLAILTAYFLPEDSFLVVFPLLLAGFAALPAALSRHPRTWHAPLVALLPAAGAAIVSFETAWFFYAAMGAVLLPLASILVALAVSALAPLFIESGIASRKFALISSILVVLAAALLFPFLPAFTTSLPQRMNFSYFSLPAASKNFWAVSLRSANLPQTVRQAAAFSASKTPLLPWLPPVFTASAAQLHLPAPELALDAPRRAAGKLIFRGRLRSPRGAPVADLAFPPGTPVSSFLFAGHPVPPLSARALRSASGWLDYSCATLPPEGIAIEFTLAASAPLPLDIYAVDQSFGLPLEGSFLESARPSITAPSQDGDVTLVARKFSLPN